MDKSKLLIEFSLDEIQEAKRLFKSCGFSYTACRPEGICKTMGGRVLDFFPLCSFWYEEGRVPYERE